MGSILNLGQSFIFRVEAPVLVSTSTAAMKPPQSIQINARGINPPNVGVCVQSNTNNMQVNSAVRPFTPSVKELEKVLYGGRRSGNHVDEVWPNLFIGDM